MIIMEPKGHWRLKSFRIPKKNLPQFCSQYHEVQFLGFAHTLPENIFPMLKIVLWHSWEWKLLPMHRWMFNSRINRSFSLLIHISDSLFTILVTTVEFSLRNVFFSESQSACACEDSRKPDHRLCYSTVIYTRQKSSPRAAATGNLKCAFDFTSQNACKGD